jgi:phytoene dehydrogenase-like protein
VPDGRKTGDGKAERQMRKVLILLAGVTLAACGGASGEIGSACVRAGREAATSSLCTCIQRVANQSLSTADQRRAADFFGDPERAEEVRRSDATRDDEFWARYRAFADRAEATCG